MSKKKKSKEKKNFVPLSPEAYIRKKARKLPIIECVINSTWKDSGLANIIIARKHTNGNITIGLYLIDNYCRGVKDTFYKFNISKKEYNEIRTEVFSDEKAEVCSYPMAHNIIYGAMEFADDFGFAPHKDFLKTTINILEEDDENVELIDIEFGLDGKPCLVVNPDENCANAIARLEKSAGPGNFDIIYLDENGNELYTDDDEYDDFNEDDIEDSFIETSGELDEIKNWTENDWKDFKAGKREVSENTLALLLNMFFYSMFDKNVIDQTNEEVERLFDLEIDYEPHNKLQNQELLEQVSLLDTVAENGNPKRAAKLARNLLKEHSDNPELYITLLGYYKMAEMNRKAEDLIIYSYNRFPDHLATRVHYALHLVTNGKTEKAKEVLENKWSLPELFPSRQSFQVFEVLLFNIVLFYYYLETGQILKADLLFNAIAEKGIFDDYIDSVFDDLQEAKMMLVFSHLEKMPEFGKNNFIDDNPMKIVR